MMNFQMDNIVVIAGSQAYLPKLYCLVKEVSNKLH